MSESSRKRRERKRAEEKAKKQQQQQRKLHLEEGPKEKKGILSVLRPIELISGGLLIGSLLLYGVSRCSRTEELPAPEVVSVDSTAAQAASSAATANLLKYYVVLDSLKFRTGPYLDSTLIRYLPHGEELVSLNEVTDFEQGLRVSVDEFTREPWVKVRDKNGREGWVYGAGVRPYRKNKPAPRPEPAAEEEGENSNSETEQEN